MSGRVFFGTEPEPEPALAVVGLPDVDETHALYRQLHDEHQRVAAAAWTGLLVTRCTNEQLRCLSTILPMRDTFDLRRMGLLAADEGFDGTKESRRWCDAVQAEWYAAAPAQRSAKARRDAKDSLS